MKFHGENKKFNHTLVLNMKLNFRFVIQKVFPKGNTKKTFLKYVNDTFTFCKTKTECI